MDAHHALHLAFGIFGNATALYLFLVPLTTFKNIVKSKSTEQLSGIPYVETLLNCLLSAWYGLPFVSEHNILVSTINGTGAGIEIIYVLIFIIYAGNKEKIRILELLTFVLSVFGFVVFGSLFALNGHDRKFFCGLAATIFSIIMSIMRMVIKTKSVEFMPFLCATSWFVFGLLGKDPFVAVPNGFACALGMIQLILYMIYRNKGESPQPAAVADVELGEAPALEKLSKSPNGNNDKGEPNKPATVDVELGEASAIEKPSKSPNGNNDKGEPNKPTVVDVELGEAPALEKPSKSPNGNSDKGKPNKPAVVDIELGEAPALEKPSKSPNGNA